MNLHNFTDSLPVQIRGWKVWEQETASNDHEFANGINYQKH